MLTFLSAVAGFLVFGFLVVWVCSMLVVAVIKVWDKWDDRHDIPRRRDDKRM